MDGLSSHKRGHLWLLWRQRQTGPPSNGHSCLERLNARRMGFPNQDVPGTTVSACEYIWDSCLRTLHLGGE